MNALADIDSQFESVKERVRSGALSLQQGTTTLRALVGKLSDDTPDERRLKAMITNTIGVNYSVAGNVEASNDYYRLSRDLWLTLDQPIAALHIELNMVLNLMRTGAFQRNIDDFDALLARGEALSGPNLAAILAYARLYRCASQIKLGETPLADILRETQAIFDRLMNTPEDIDQENLERLRAESLLTVAELHLRMGAYPQAYQAIQAASAFAQADAILEGLVYQATGDLITYAPGAQWGTDADKAYGSAQKCFSKVNAQDSKGHGFFAQAYSAARRGQFDRAVHAMNQAVGCYSAISKTFRMRKAVEALRLLDRKTPFEPKPFFIGE